MCQRGRCVCAHHQVPRNTVDPDCSGRGKALLPVGEGDFKAPLPLFQPFPSFYPFLPSSLSVCRDRLSLFLSLPPILPLPLPLPHSLTPSRFRENSACINIYRLRAFLREALSRRSVRVQPASAGCRAAARWGFLLRRHHVLSSASSCPAIGFGWLLEGAPHCTICPPPSPQTGSHPPIRTQSISWAQHLHL